MRDGRKPTWNLARRRALRQRVNGALEMVQIRASKHLRSIRRQILPPEPAGIQDLAGALTERVVVLRGAHNIHLLLTRVIQ